MKRGQISFDFVFALIAFLLVLQFLVFFAESIETSQNSFVVGKQAKTIALNVARIVDLNKAFFGDSEVSYKIPLIEKLDGSNVPCAVSVQEDKVVVSADSKEYVVPTTSSFFSGTFECGSFLEFGDLS